MNIPKKFKLGGFTWTVVMRKRLKGKYGDCDLKNLRIHILDSLAPEMKEQTFCHELTHAIWFAMGKDQETHNEEAIDGFAMFLHQYFNTAEYETAV